MAEAGETPAPLRLVEDFVNTRSVELSTDDLDTPAALGEWLQGRGLLPAGTPVDAEDQRRAVRLREGVRALVAANRGDAAVDAGARGRARPGCARRSRRTGSAPPARRRRDARPAPARTERAGHRRRRARRGARGDRRRGGRRVVGTVQGVPGARMPMGVLRPLPQPVARVVLDGDVRQPSEGAGVPQPRPVKRAGRPGQGSAARTRRPRPRPRPAPARGCAARG